ncbi:MAG: hypothetical protein JW806_10230 [Sedimentisphaerales bacterium]|nr:hypothetical protein [Sedimentisphaerales bacterium]
MHLVKWFRKNMSKLMAIFVIIIMLAFIMPSVLKQLARPKFKSTDKPMWFFNKDKSISRNDIAQATRELSVLKMLYIDDFLLSQPDLRFKLLGQLLFPQAARGSLLSDDLKRTCVRMQFRIDPERIDDFFAQASGRAELFWILLKAETENVSYTMTVETAGKFLDMLLTKMTDGRVNAAAAVQNVGRSNQMTDDMVVQTFADLLSVLRYIKTVTGIEDVTEAQMEFIAAKTQETVSAEFVEFANEIFINEIKEPGEEKILAQFEKYKNNLPGIITEDNPCGFGYKQEPKAAIEYMIIKLEDMKKLVDKPTEDETEDFYQQNLDAYTEQYPIDPNNPDSDIAERQRSYAEVADNIKETLMLRKVSAKAMSILNTAVQQADEGFSSLNFDTADVSQFRQAAKDYAQVAENIAKQNNIKIYTGKTNLVTQKELQKNNSIGFLVIQAQSSILTRLPRYVFAAEQFGKEAVKLGPFEPAKPKMYVSIGPVSDNMRTVIGIVRVIEAENSSVPQDINLSYKKNLPSISENDKKDEDAFSLKDNVIQDCKKFAAFELARQKANDFAKMAKDIGWDKAVDKYNSLCPAKGLLNTQKTFETKSWNQKRRLSQVDIETVKLSMSQSPIAEEFIKKNITNAALVNKFYSLLEPQQTKIENVPVVVEFEPQLACYVVKSFSRQPETVQNYEQTRQRIAFREDYIITQSIAVEYLMPENITKRAGLRIADESNDSEQQELTEPNGV